MEDEQKQGLQVSLDASGPYDWKVIGGYVAYGVFMMGAAYFFGSRVEKRCVKRVNVALHADWLSMQNNTPGGEE